VPVAGTELISAPTFGWEVCARATDDINDVAAAARMNPERMWERMFVQIPFLERNAIAQLATLISPLSFLRCDKGHVDTAPTKGCTASNRPSIRARVRDLHRGFSRYPTPSICFAGVLY
jgi:hypothetical protein